MATGAISDDTRPMPGIGIPSSEAAGSTGSAVVLVVDVSGFTALTAALEAKLGRRAADRLAAVMDDLLGSFAGIVGTHRGTVLDIVGDAIQAVWSVADDRDATVFAGWAGRAALAMIAHVRDADATVAAGAEDAFLPVRIGLGAGPLTTLVMGDGTAEGDRLSWGPALIDAAQITGQAEIGGIVVHERARALFEAAFEGRRRDGCWDLLRARDDDDGAATSPTPSRVSPMVADSAVAAWTAELRSATILFVRLFRVEETAQATPAQVRNRIALVRPAIAAQGGQLDKIHVDEKGMAAVFAFGLPPAPTADAALRAVGAAIDLRAEFKDYGIDVAIGIATGKVRAGMGSAYGDVHHTIYGGAANLAARCMQACRNEILTDSATRALAADAFAFLAPETHVLKGLGSNVTIYGVSDARERHEPVTLSDATPIAGRRDDIALVEAFVRGDSGRRLFLLDGEVGVGKSRLAGHAAAFAAAQGQALLICRAGPLASRISLFAWRDPAASLLRDFARRQNLRLGDAQAALTEAAGETPALAPLTNPLFGRELGDTNAISDPEGRPRLARRLQAMVLGRLLGEAARLIVIDDAQWLDEASALLAADLIGLNPRLRILIVGRSPLASVTAIFGDEAPTRHTLSPLDRHGTAELAASMLGAVDRQHPLIDWLHERARGNPLFSRELLRTLPADLLRGGLASPGAWRDAETELRDLDLPQTIEDAALTRLEARPLPQLGIVKAASVIGDSFTREALLALDLPVPEAALDETLAVLVRDALFVPEGSGWRFAQALLREAVYDSLPDAIRTDLHRKAVTYFEGLALAKAGSASARIAYHWLEAGEPVRALAPLRRAGVEAARAGAYADSLNFFETALDIALNNPEAQAIVKPLRRAQLHFDVCNAHHILGDHHKAVAPALAGLAGLWPGAPKGRLGWSWMATREAILLAAVITAPSLARRDRQSARARARNRLRSLVASRLSDCLFNIEGTLPAVACSLFAARSAERSGDLSLTAQPYGLISYVAGLVRLDRIARFLGDRAMADCVRKDDLSGVHRALFSKVFLAVSLGRWNEVSPLFDEALALNARYRSDRHHGLMLTAVGFMHQFRGDFEAMRRTYAEVGALGVAAAIDQFIDWAELVYGRLALYDGDPVAAEAHFDKSKLILGRISEVQAVFIADTMGALAILRQGRIDAVEPRAAELLARVRSTPLQFGSTDAYGALAEIMNALLARFGPGAGGRRWAQARQARAHMRRCARVFPVARPVSALHEGQFACLAGQSRAAEKLWRRGLAVADALDMKYDAARLHAALATLPGLGESARADHAARSAALAAACGVTGVPPLPISFAVPGPEA
jgi:class 3 adenylate cyclase